MSARRIGTGKPLSQDHGALERLQLSLQFETSTILSKVLNLQQLQPDVSQPMLINKRLSLESCWWLTCMPATISAKMTFTFTKGHALKS